MQTHQHIGIVIRQDGTVPFDESTPDEQVAHTLLHLTRHGHVYEPVPGTRNVKIKNWDPKKQNFPGGTSDTVKPPG